MLSLLVAANQRSDVTFFTLVVVGTSVIFHNLTRNPNPQFYVLVGSLYNKDVKPSVLETTAPVSIYLRVSMSN